MNERMPRRAAQRERRPEAPSAGAFTSRRGVSLTVLIVNQLIAGVGVASGITVAAILVADLSAAPALGGLAQSSSVLGAAVVAIPLARLAVRSGRHVALAVGYALAAVGAVLVIAAAASGWWGLVFLGLAAFGAGTAAGLQARFAATEVAAPGFEARAMSLVLWATTIGSVAGPLFSQAGDDFGLALGLPEFVGSFIFSGIAFGLSCVLVATLLRSPRAGHLATDSPAPGSAPQPAAGPDELASGTEARTETRPADVKPVGALSALRTAARNPTALVAILAIVCSHTVMIGVMVMTPIHMTEHGLSLTLVGLVLSIHILGMFGASPIMGWLADRIGSLRVIMIGAGLLITATVIGILAPDNVILLPLALGILGLGWSAGLIGGSTLLTTTVDERLRVPLQGATDATMNVAAATSAAFSGLVLGLGGFAALNVVAIFVLVPLAIAALRLRSTRRSAPA